MKFRSSEHVVECGREFGQMTVRLNGLYIVSCFRANKAQEIAMRIFEAIQEGEEKSEHGSQ